MKRSLTLSCLILAMTTTIPAAATTYIVRPDGTGDFPTIQEAIDAAVDGDVIELTDGTFTGDGNRDTDFLGKAITVRSQSGEAGACVIDCENSGRGFSFHSAETPSSVLSGIEITRGFAEYGGGINCAGSAPSIYNCVLYACISYYAGGGIFCGYNASPIIVDCAFVGNVSNQDVGHGGGMACAYDSDATLVGCTFWGNQADTRGGGFHCGQESSATLSNCTFYGNTCSAGSGIGLRDHAFALLLNCIVSFGLEGSGLYGELGSSATLMCCDVYGNEGGDWVGIIEDQFGINGNFSEDPLFCDAENGDYRLYDCSPCLPDNHPQGFDCGLIGAWGQGCGATAVEEASWGRIKSLYRR